MIEWEGGGHKIPTTSNDVYFSAGIRKFTVLDAHNTQNLAKFVMSLILDITLIHIL